MSCSEFKKYRPNVNLRYGKIELLAQLVNIRMVKSVGQEEAIDVKFLCSPQISKDNNGSCTAAAHDAICPSLALDRIGELATNFSFVWMYDCPDSGSQQVRRGFYGGEVATLA